MHWRHVYAPTAWGTLFLLLSPGFLGFDTTGKPQPVVIFGMELSEMTVYTVARLIPANVGLLWRGD